MESMPKIHLFALKWLNKFNDTKINSNKITSPDFGKECEELKFVMDEGESFSEKYGSAIYYNTEGCTRDSFDTVDDIMILGSAIYSKWTQHVCQSFDPIEIMDPSIRIWFIISLERLVILSCENSESTSSFRGELAELQIESNGFSDGYSSKNTTVEKQVLKLDSYGGISYSSYIQDNGNRYKEKESQNDRNFIVAHKTIPLFEHYYLNHYIVVSPEDKSDWTIMLKNKDGEVFYASGPFGGIMLNDGSDLSEVVRDELEMQNLFLMDGNCWDRIDRIEVEYCRSKMIGNYTETLILNRKEETITYKQNEFRGLTTDRSFSRGKELSIFLDELNTDTFFRDKDGGESDTKLIKKDKWGTTSKYTVTITYRKKSKMTYSGDFSQEGLPKEFHNFITAVNELVHDCEQGEMFDSGLYTRTYPKNGELTVCSVIFPNDDNTYLYLQDRCFLKVGDHVRIPFGPEDKYTTGTIVKIECLLPEQLPVSVDQIKHITSEPYKSSIHSMALVYKKQHWQEIMESTRE